MKLHPVLAFVVLSLLINDGLAKDAVRAVILPPAVTEPYLELKEDSLALADYLQGKLQDIPGVEWVERGELDKLLGEADPAKTGGGSVSAIKLGRLLKADIVLCGQVNSPQPKNTADGSVWLATTSLQVIDLTNADVLAEHSWEGEGRLEGAITGQELDKAAAEARSLLKTALANRRAEAKKTALAPVFFANSGASPRLDHWEENWQQALHAEASSSSNVRLLHFSGVQQAAQEQKLSLLGLTEADPAAWQNAARGYIWGEYRELPTEKTTAFEDTEVEADLFLWMRQGEPAHFSRRFAVKDFPSASRALAREILQAASQANPAPVAPDAGVKTAELIFARLRALVGGGFFANDPVLSSLLPTNHYMGASGEAVLAPIQRLPQASQKVAYCRRMLDLACFFDPANNRRQMLRWTLSNPVSFMRGNPDAQLAPMAECIELLERLARAREFDAAAFIQGADAINNRLVSWQQLAGWRSEETAGDGKRHVLFRPPPDLPAQRQALLTIYYPLLMEKLPAIAQQLDTAQISGLQRGFLASWMHTTLGHDVSAETRLKYLQVARPLTPHEQNLEPLYERLMTDLGDRKRVQDALTPPELALSRLPQPPPANPPRGRGQPSLAPGRPGLPPPAAEEPLLAGVTILPKPPLMRHLPVSLRQRLPALTAKPQRAAGQTAPLLADQIRAALNGSYERGVGIQKIQGWGDQLILALSTPRGVVGHDPCAYVLYQDSTGAARLLDSPDAAFFCGPDARAIYQAEELTGSLDLLSGKDEVFSLDAGLPVTYPVMIGFDASGRGIVAGGGEKAVAGLFDWTKRQWLTLPPPPVAPPADAAPEDASAFRRQRMMAQKAWGVGDLAIFPKWNLLYDQAAQSWRQLPAGACAPLQTVDYSAPAPRRLDIDAGDLFCEGDHLWSWNERGITDFSLKENRVLWHADAQRLAAVCPDGPYLWMAFGPLWAGPSLPGRPPVLALFDRTRRTVLGAMTAPRASALYADERHLWMNQYGGLGFSDQPDVFLFRADRAALYAALNQTPPPQTPLRSRKPQNAEEELYTAILRDDSPTVARLLQKGVSANSVLGLNRVPALVVAAGTGDASLCQMLVQKGAKIDAAFSGQDGPWTALDTAALMEYRDVLSRLLKLGAKPTETALAEAVRNNDADSAEALIKAKAPLGKLMTMLIEPRFNSPEVDAARERLARRLLDLRLPLSSADQTQLAVFANAAESITSLGDDPRQASKLITDALRRRQWDQAAKLVRLVPRAQINDSAMREALSQSIYAVAKPAVEAFLDQGASLSKKPGDTTQAPLRESTGKPEIFTLLLQRGADPRETDEQADTLGETVVRSQYAADILPALFTKYPNLNQSFGYGTFGGTLLCAAVITRANSLLNPDEGLEHVTRIVQTLLDCGIPPGTLGREGFTALHAAFFLRCAGLACLLAGRGADLQARDLAGRDIFNAPYLTVGSRSFLEQLRAYQPKSDAETQGQRRLLQAIDMQAGSYAELREAVSGNQLERARKLLRNGADIVPPCTAAVNDPATALAHQPGLVFLAVKNGAREMTQLLLDAHCDPNIGEGGLEHTVRNGGPQPFNGTVQPTLGYYRPQPALECKTPLMLAAELNNRALVDLLLDHGAYAPAADRSLRNAIDAAATPELAKHITERAHAQFEAAKCFGVAVIEPMRRLMIQGKPEVEMVEIFSVRNVRGDTLVTQLLSNIGLTPKWGASERAGLSQEALTTLADLRRLGVPLNELDEFGVTLLHRAVVYAQTQDVAALVEAGFDPRQPDRRGITALDLVERILQPKQRAEVLAALQGKADDSTKSPP